ncbi:MAG: acyl carrier protein [Clostridiaceae bacterium]|nr:acyl carrier protein [Clostridiaceae bacterium]
MKPVESDHAVSEPDPDADRERVSDLEDVAERQKERIYDSLMQMVTELTGLSPTDIKPGTEIIADLGFDSLQIYELVVDLESTYDIRLSDDDLDKVVTVQDVVDLVYFGSQ